MSDTPEDQNKKAKELQEKFAAAMNPETPKGEVVVIKDFLMKRILKHQVQAQEYLEQAKKLDSSGDVTKCPFAAPLMAKMNSELAAATRIKEHVQFIIQREHEIAVSKIVPRSPVMPVMNWNMGPTPPKIG